MTPERGTAPGFRPVRGTWIAGIVGVAVLLGALYLAAWLPPETYGTMDRLLCAAIGIAVAAFMYRYATIRAVPTVDGLWVRNLGSGELLPWEEIEAVRFSQGMPWPRLDMRDGTEHAVMAIQRSDGPRSVEDAQRLADLVGR